MKDFIIVTDSCSDLSADLRKKYSIEYVPMHFSFDGRDYPADLDWNTFSPKQYYDLMRNGTRILTAQVNAEQFVEAFEGFIQRGLDVIYVGCSSALSASVKSSFVAKQKLMQKYPDSKIECIDSLISCMGLGILCITAAELKAEGKSFDEVVQWIKSSLVYVHQEATVDKLIYLKQAGRVTATSAFFGGLLNIKPIIVSDALGRNSAIEKVKGRGTAIARLAQRFKEQYQKFPFQKIYIAHADAESDAMLLKVEVQKVLDELGEDLEINVGYIGPIIGASTGPGTLGLYFFGSDNLKNQKVSE